MINGTKIIGVCLTLIQDVSRMEFVNRLHWKAFREGYRTMVFNSPVDFYNHDDYDAGAKSVYQTINYDIIDVLVVLWDNYYDKEIPIQIIKNAHEHNTPVILIRGEKEGCCSIISDYKEGFKAMMNHVIREHQAKDTFFIAGKAADDSESEKRIECYKEVLEENSLPFSDSMVAYGEYWDGPVIRIIEDMVSDGKKPPRAIFCANDYMAFAACETLQKYGHRVPEDVIVTGFDGVPATGYFTPRLTTCKEDYDKLSSITLEAINNALLHSKTSETYLNTYAPHYTESCGCNGDDANGRKAAFALFHKDQSVENHEGFIYAWMDRMLDMTDISQLSQLLPNWIHAGSYVCLNSDFIAKIMGSSNTNKTEISDNLEIISSKWSHVEIGRKNFRLSEIIPDSELWLQEESLYIINPVFSGNEVFGYYALKTADLIAEAHKINRVSKCINISLNSAVNMLRQRLMAINLKNAALTDSVTTLPNIKGITGWFEKFSAVPENHQKCITVTIYALPKYKYIYENYGINEIEEAVCLVAEALKHANPNNCYIARTADDEFLVINWFDKQEEISDAIDISVTSFYKIIDSYNNSLVKDYYVEVNCGCTEAYSGWTGTLETFSKLASGKMYINRLNRGMASATNDISLPKEYYAAFEALVSNNLFYYHFQPIVDVPTGEIYAYEALMRSDKSIGMNPLQIIQTAEEYGRLYDIEKATMFNVMEHFSTHFSDFKGRRVFINSIPGQFLKTIDYNKWESDYAEYLKYLVFEITEESTITDDELMSIKNIGSADGGCPIAIDDYGTGHSNIVNLLRYTPQIIKIDRYLITDIQNDKNKQMFVSSTIEFAKLNDIKVLAEGVETSEELQTVIRLGADLVQGYYTGRPSAEIADSIPYEIKKEITDCYKAIAE